MPLRTKLVVLASLLAVASATGELRVRVASSSGGGPTTSSELHATTLGEAADLVAAHLAVSSRDVTVELAPGAHRVPLGGLKLDASHTPADRNHKVVWMSEVGARTSVTGGIQVTGWKLTDDPTLPKGVMEAPVPASWKGKRARHLYVGGARANRTRSTKTFCVSNDSLISSSSEPLSWPNPDDVEFGWPGAAGSGWSEPRCGALSVVAHTGSGCSSPAPGAKACAADHGKDTPCCGQKSDPGTKVSPQYQCPADTPTCVGYVFDSHYGHCTGTGPAPPPGNASGARIVMRQPCFWNLVHRPYQPINTIPPTWVENVKSDLASPGEFYYDTAGSLIFYYPHVGEDMATLPAILAVEEVLVLHNSSAQHQWVGITFEYATWLRPMEGLGFVELQSAACAVCPYGTVKGIGCGAGDTGAVTPGNVVVAAGRDISFDNCTFQHLGAYASSAHNGSQGIAWRGCTFQDVSAGSLMLGDINTYNETDENLWDLNFTLSDSVVRNIPVEYTGATGVFAAYVQGLRIEHNHIANTSYSGMTIGWGWGREGSGRGDNHVIGNLIENPQRARCCDGGAIYTLGPQPGSSLSRNYIKNVPPVDGGRGQAVYHDNGSGGWNDTELVIDGVFNNACFLNTPLGNYGHGKQCPTGGARQQGDCSVFFDHNWLRTAAGTSDCPLATATSNTKIAANAALPAAAQAIVAAAGPRVQVQASSLM